MPSQNELSRFLIAQENTYARALSEIKKGQKRTHWMWFIFPQIKGLGTTETSIKYSIENLDEAIAYLNHPVLGERLKEITSELLKLKSKSAYEIFGSPDDKKLKSCMTLFSIVSPKPSSFHSVLEQYFNGEEDKRTLEILMR
jgi:uncharacterized protein (DUF1810 family)